MNKTIRPAADLMAECLQNVSQAMPSTELVTMALKCLDLTSLTRQETAEDIKVLCDKAKVNNVAGVCVFPEKIRMVADFCRCSTVVAIAVVNFPDGCFRNDGTTATFETTYDDTRMAIANGAEDIDIVIDYNDFDGQNARQLLRGCRKACNESKDYPVRMKVIIETAALSLDSIEFLTAIAIEEGADFIKTSTGKYKDPEFPEDHGGATLDAVYTILQSMKQFQKEKTVGLKISGGVTIDNFASFMVLVKKQMGEDFLKPETFRIGASGILNDLIHYAPNNRGNDEIKKTPPVTAPGY